MGKKITGICLLKILVLEGPQNKEQKEGGFTSRKILESEKPGFENSGFYTTCKARKVPHFILSFVKWQ